MKKNITGRGKSRGKTLLEQEQEDIMILEENLLKSFIRARKKVNLTQKELSEETGVTQPVISKLETGVHSAHIRTLIKILYAMGYRLKIVPLDTTKIRRR